MKMQELYKIAKETLNPRKISRNGEAGHVASALLTESGNVYTGVAITVPCSIGFCAEHSAIAAMVTAGESKIVKIVAVYEDGSILPPCGRCREFISQINDDNDNCGILLPDHVIRTLGELLPDRWDYKWN
ncbi:MULTISPECIES: cytidine deaminase family protein [Bacillaceae]|uniref:Cytidine deaminase n=1 Tax=Ornithinibacillus halotolerans TaxID=1274357 RepID=A0A916RX98_9BACI|nr:MULTISPECIES: cytidine deaminase [Bacillaceae]GGA75289.1 cytidine deaminase [Ornithinibacillus halotolerans]